MATPKTSTEDVAHITALVVVERAPLKCRRRPPGDRAAPKRGDRIRDHEKMHSNVRVRCTARQQLVARGP